MSGPDILGRITRDAEIYFGVIAVSHFVVVIMLAAVRNLFFFLASVFKFNVCLSLPPYS